MGLVEGGLIHVIFNSDLRRLIVVDVLTSEITFDGAVLEPAAWPLMVGGFGVLGAAICRRRSVASHA